MGASAPLADIVQATVQRYAGAGPPVRLQLQAVQVQAPDGAVQRLLANLIDNVLAYGGGDVDVSLRATTEGAELRVGDAGPGMSEQEFEGAQQPFVRLTRTRSELGHCGLGLAIVAQVARKLGGRMRPERDADGRFGIVFSLPR